MEELYIESFICHQRIGDGGGVFWILEYKHKISFVEYEDFSYEFIIKGKYENRLFHKIIGDKKSVTYGDETGFILVKFKFKETK